MSIFTRCQKSNLCKPFHSDEKHLLSTWEVSQASRSFRGSLEGFISELQPKGRGLQGDRDRRRMLPGLFLTCAWHVGLHKFPCIPTQDMKVLMVSWGQVTRFKQHQEVCAIPEHHVSSFLGPPPTEVDQHSHWQSAASGPKFHPLAGT